MNGPYIKAFGYLDLLAVADHLKLKPEQINAPGSTSLVMAFLTVQDLKYTSVLIPGTQGNQIKIEYLDTGTAGEETASIADGVISVSMEDGVSTADQIKAAIEADFETNRWVSVAVTGTGSTAQLAAAVAPFAGGTDATGFDARLYRSIVRFMNASCDWFEKEIDGPVIVREYTGDYDGSNSNVIKPNYFPVRAVTSLKIDYNRQFPTSAAMNASQYFIRGSEQRRQISGAMQVELNGSDIVLRDDNETFIVGRIFSGSVLGSIELKYLAGLAYTSFEVPEDIMQATLQLLEYWYFQRENRDIAVSSKGVRGESYTKLKGNIPEEIVDIALKYTDFAFGGAPVPQRNYFKS